MIRQRFDQLVAASKGYVSSVAVLSTLAGIGLWGHINHWKLSHADTSAHGEPAVATANPASHVQDAKPAAAQPAPAKPKAEPSAKAAKPQSLTFKSTESLTKSGVELVEARESPIDHSILANGVVDYDQTRKAQLSTRVPGIAWRVEKHAGQAVKKGDILAIVEALAVGDAKSDLLKSLAQMELKVKVLARLDSSVVAARQIQEVEAQLREARIALFTAQQNLVNLGLPISSDELAPLSDEQRAARIRFLGLPEEIASGLDPERTTANLIPLIAPFDGVVISREMTVGEVVSPSEPQFVVADVQRMWINLDVRQEDALQLELGQDVSFLPDGLPSDFRSTISWIATEVDPKTRTVKVRAQVENPLIDDTDGTQGEQRLLRANTYGTGRIRVSENAHAVVVPSRAVQWDGDCHVVFVETQGTSFEARKVELGAVAGDVSEVVTGLNAGERVATVGSHLIKSELLRRRIANAGG